MTKWVDPRLVQKWKISQFTILSKQKRKSHDHLNICRKIIDKIQHPFMIKKKQMPLSKLGIYGNFLIKGKRHLSKKKKPTSNIILISERWNVFPLKLGAR